jgi:RNA polymerase sigma factor (TIGR02999 family)
MEKVEQTEVTRLLLSWSSGDRKALDQLLPIIYNELHCLAAVYMRRERAGHTLRTTELVHEAYLRLIGQGTLDVRSRSEFFGIAANLMRQVLIRHADRRNAAKRGGGARVALDDLASVPDPRETDVLAFDHALRKLKELNPRQEKIVELRFFGGLTEREIAGMLQISEATVKREWRSAKAMLRAELHDSSIE